MASYSVAFAKHATLSGTTVDTVTITGGHTVVEVLNESTSAVLDFTVDGSTPTAGGNDTYRVVAGGALTVPVGGSFGPSVVVKLIGNGNSYSVTGIS